ncbi:MAG: hypothetical protein CR988_05825 [Treponema sp.]|nr:MAG: hypothetical protein CR988_05825 [Treponema sp.]
MSKIKTSLYSAGAGALISFILGLIAKVAIWVVLLRAVLLGCFLGGFVYFALYLFEKYIPGLFETKVPKEVNEVGQNIDITIDDPEKGNEDYTLDEEKDSFIEKVAQNDDALDELPNLSEFEGISSSLDGDEPIDFVEEGTDGMMRKKGADSDTVDVETMAKAIHTVLERES